MRYFHKAVLSSTSGFTPPATDPISTGDVNVMLLPVQAAADMHFGQAQGDGQTHNQNPGSDTWTFPDTDLWEKVSAPGTGQPGDVIRLTTLPSHAGVSGSERRTEFSFRGSGGGYDYDLSLNTTYWFWVRYYMPTRVLMTGGHISPWQFHSKVGGNPPSASYVDGSTADINGRNDGGTAFTTQTVTHLYDQWVNDIVRVRMDPSGSTGILQVYRNGSLIVNQTGLTFGYAGNDGYVKFGQYVYPSSPAYTDFTGGSPSYSELSLHVAGSGMIADTGYTHADIEQHVGFHTGS